MARHPLLTCPAQLDHLKSKGVEFALCSEKEAEEYLLKNNNYFKVCAYRKNFQKHPAGPNAGKYVGLDFAMLRDLAIIDMRMRYTFMHLILDIEHFSKVKLINTLTNNVDPYDIVDQFFKHASDKRQEILRNRNNPYCGGLIDKYEKDMPVWVFLELISFGTLIEFYKFCASNLHSKDLESDRYLLIALRQLRNACAHSNCLIGNMGQSNAERKLPYEVNEALARCNIGKRTRETHSRNEPLRQITIMLYFYSKQVTSEGARERAGKELRNLIERMNKHAEFYQKNQIILPAFQFFEKVVAGLFTI